MGEDFINQLHLFLLVETPYLGEVLHTDAKPDNARYENTDYIYGNLYLITTAQHDGDARRRYDNGYNKNTLKQYNKVRH